LREGESQAVKSCEGCEYRSSGRGTDRLVVVMKLL
jgi:hypothetical protein